MAASTQHAYPSHGHQSIGFVNARCSSHIQMLINISQFSTVELVIRSSVRVVDTHH